MVRRTARSDWNPASERLWIKRPSYKTLPPLNEVDIPLPTGAAQYRRTQENSMFCHRGIAAKIDVVGAVLGSFLFAPSTPRFRRT